jgi:hypothetical protein
LDIAQQLAEGVAALRDGRAADAVALLSLVVEDDAFGNQPDLRDLHARSCSLLAQALLQSGQPGKARVAVKRALDSLRALDDTEGVQQVQELQQQIGQAMVEQFGQMASRRGMQRLSETPIKDVLGSVSDPAERAALLVRHASAMLQSNRPDQVATLCEAAVQEARLANDPRHEVLALIAWSSAAPERAAELLEKARQCADQHDEFTLLTSVVKAAAQQGLVLDSTHSVT